MSATGEGNLSRGLKGAAERDSERPTHDCGGSALRCKEAK